MRSPLRWLAAGVFGAAVSLAAPLAASAQAPAFPGETPGNQSPPPANPTTAPTTSGVGGGQGTFQPPPAIRPGQALSVLVFPFSVAAEADTSAGTTADASQRLLADYATASVKSGLLSSPAFAVTTFSPRSPLIERARRDDVLSTAHLTDLVQPDTGVVDVDKARTIAQRLGIQSVMLGSVEVTQNAEGRSAEATLDARLINSVTGEVMRSAAVAGAAVGAEGVPMSAVQERAIHEATMRMLPELGIQLVAPPVEPEKDANGRPAGSGRNFRVTPRGGRGSQPAAGNSAAEAKRAAEQARENERQSLRAAQKAKRDAEKERERREKSGGDRSDAGDSRQDIERFKRGEQPAPKAVPVSGEEEDAQQPAPAQPAPATAAPAAPATDATPTVQPSAQRSIAVPGTTVQGIATPQGTPDPYGYAKAERQETRSRRSFLSGLKVPPWLGLAAFVAGVGFLF